LGGQPPKLHNPPENISNRKVNKKREKGGKVSASLGREIKNWGLADGRRTDPPRRSPKARGGLEEQERGTKGCKR